MTSARKKAAETLAVADVVVEVLDARLPQASSNPMIHELRTFRQRPCLKLLNKADLIDEQNAVALNALLAVREGALQVQGTINGVGDWGMVRGQTRHTDADSAKTEVDLLRALAQARGAAIQ